MRIEARVSWMSVVLAGGLLLAGWLLASAVASAEVVGRVSLASDGSQANAGSFNPTVSANGRFVAFDSEATNLVPGDTNGVVDVFIARRLRSDPAP